MMLQGVSLSLVAWGRYHNDWGGQMLVIFIITVAACEAAIALALVLMLFRASGKLDIAVWQRAARGRTSRRTSIARCPRPSREAETQWPTLTPAGVEPDTIGRMSPLARKSQSDPSSACLTIDALL